MLNPENDTTDDTILEEEYDFDLIEESSDSEPNPELQNQYFKAKGMRKINPQIALLGFERVLELEGEEKGEWGFRALKHIVKIYFNLGNIDQMMVRHQQLLTYVEKAVTNNQAEKVIDSLLDLIDTLKNNTIKKKFFEVTLDALKTKNQRIQFRSNIKLANVFLETSNFHKAYFLLKKLHKGFSIKDYEDPIVAKQIMEVILLEIKLYYLQKNHLLLDFAAVRSMKLRGIIKCSLPFAVINEFVGKIYMKDQKWEFAGHVFMEALAFYAKANSPREKNILKYLLLKSLIDGKETLLASLDIQQVKNDPEYNALKRMVNHIQDPSNIHKFFTMYNKFKNKYITDPFILKILNRIVHETRVQNMEKFYKHNTPQYYNDLCLILCMDESEVESLLVHCIMNGKIHGRLDQINKYFIPEININENKNEQHQKALSELSDRLDSLYTKFNLELREPIYKTYCVSSKTRPTLPPLNTLLQISNKEIATLTGCDEKFIKDLQIPTFFNDIKEIIHNRVDTTISSQ